VPEVSPVPVEAGAAFNLSVRYFASMSGRLIALRGSVLRLTVCPRAMPIEVLALTEGSAARAKAKVPEAKAAATEVPH